MQRFLAMLYVPTPESSPAPLSSPSRITSSPTPSTEPSPDTQHTSSASLEPQPTNSSPIAEHHVPTPHDSPLHTVHSHGSAEGSVKLNELTDLLILRVKKFETRVKIGKARRRVRIVFSEEEDVLDDSFKQGRKILDIDEDPHIYLALDDGVEWIQEENAEEKEVSTAELPVSTAGVSDSTASVIPTVSTASTIHRETRGTAGRVVYNRRVNKKKDKGKAIITEPERVKKSKKLLEQERLGYEAAVRLQEQENAEKRAQEARDEEIAKQ
ncbi:hypothetical protein Tco_1339282 [Tanacetum coccineum]